MPAVKGILGDLQKEISVAGKNASLAVGWGSAAGLILSGVGFACILNWGQMALEGTFGLGRCSVVHFGGSLSRSQILPRQCKEGWEYYSGSRVCNLSFGRGAPPEIYFVSLVLPFHPYSIV